MNEDLTSLVKWLARVHPWLAILFIYLASPISLAYHFFTVGPAHMWEETTIDVQSAVYLIRKGAY